MNTKKGLIVLALSVLGVASANAATTTTVQWGPVHVPAMGESEALAGVSGLGGALVGLYSELHDYPVTKPCEDCYITKIVPNLVNANGDLGNYATNGLMLHHVVNFNWNSPDITCRPNIFSSQTIKQLGGLMGGNERFFASGNERTIFEMADGYGYYVSADDDWGLTYHLMNMGMMDQDVYFEFEFTWESAAEFTGQPLRPIWVDIDQCNKSERTAVAGYNDLQWGWEADRSHTIAGMGGHVHDYGINTGWYNHTKNETACNSTAGYAAGSPYAPVGPGTGVDSSHPVYANVQASDPLGLATYNGHISDMSLCQGGANGADVNKGDQMRVHTQIYRPDTVDHDMGIMIGYLDEDYCITNFWCF